jgi:DNA-binding NarL/FixJ family response regulator
VIGGFFWKGIDMDEKRVLIVSSNGLFREGLKHLLGQSPNLALMKQSSSLDEAEHLAREKKVDVVIIEQMEDAQRSTKRAEAVARLLAIPDVRVISVGLDTGDMWIYQQTRVEEVSVEDLLAAIDD